MISPLQFKLCTLYKPKTWVTFFLNRYICDCSYAMHMCILIVRPNCYHRHSSSIIIMRIWNENKNVIQKSERKIWIGEEARDSLSYYISTVDYGYNVYFVFEILELSMKYARRFHIFITYIVISLRPNSYCFCLCLCILFTIILLFFLLVNFVYVF